VRGLVVAAGGATHSTWWFPLADPDPRWATILERLQRQPDSASVSPRDVRIVRGRVQVAPYAGGIVYLQPFYAWRPDASPTLARVAVIVADSLGVGRTLAVAAGVPGSSSPSQPSTPVAFHARVAAIYAAMRAAMQRGDWVAFGRAYDELGRVLGTPPR
jgi:uncharacterized membrane protein (UPF0182 family)